jgi:methionyl-tRNA formyltransferase
MNCSPDILPDRPRIVFMGTPDFAVPSLLSLMDAGYEIPVVVTQPDRPGGRGRKPSASPVKMAAEERGGEVLQPASVNEPGFVQGLRDRAPDLVVVVAFGQILRVPLLAVPRWGTVNIHASLLPRLRGPAPIQGAILEGHDRTGLTLMCMDEGLDTGPILFQEAVSIPPDETAGRLHDRLAAMSGSFLVRSLEALCRSPVDRTPQDEARATYAPKIEPGMTWVDWARPAAAVSAQIRALDPAPGARTVLGDRTLKLFGASPALPERKGPPGRVVEAATRLVVETGDGRVAVGEIQAPGRRRMPVSEFLRGFPLEVGTRLGGDAVQARAGSL